MSIQCCILVFVAYLSAAYTQQFSSSPCQKYNYNQPRSEPCYNPCCCTGYPPLNPCQQVLTSPVYTTVIDNSVSNALANAIQLLIVSNLVESTMASKRCRNIVEEVPECANQITEVVYEVPCAPLLDALSPDQAELANLSDLTSQSPCVAEALFPSSIPAQLVCNYVQQPNPCISFNVEPVSGIEACQCACNLC